MIRILKDYIINIIALVSAIIAIFGFYDKFIESNPDKALIIAVGFITVLAFIFFLQSSFFSIKLSRRSKYAESISVLNDAFSSGHKILREKKINLNESMLLLQEFCNYLAQAFTIITSEKCSVSIKVIEELDIKESDNIKIETLVRDNSSEKKRSAGNDVVHYLKENTDFYEIFLKFNHKKELFYLNNNIPFTLGYKNSSYQIYGKPKNIIIRYLTWPLPYKSTIVVPIRPYYQDSLNGLIGFLCIDSNSLYTFKKKYDLDILNGLSDALHNILDIMLKKA